MSLITVSVIYKTADSDQKYITFCRIPGPTYNEYFIKQVCMNYNWEYVSSQEEPDPFRRISKGEKERLGVIRKPYDFFDRGRQKNGLGVELTSEL